MRENEERRTALHIAAEQGNEKMVVLLAEGGADVHAVDPGGESALHQLLVDVEEAHCVGEVPRESTSPAAARCRWRNSDDFFTGGVAELPDGVADRGVGRAGPPMECPPGRHAPAAHPGPGAPAGPSAGPPPPFFTAWWRRRGDCCVVAASRHRGGGW